MKSEQIRVALLLLPILIFLVFVSVSYALNIIATVTVVPKIPQITILSPINTIYGYSLVPVSVKIDEPVKILQMSIDGQKFQTLCTKCNSYYMFYYFEDGSHNLKFKAVNYDNNEGSNSVNFAVDSVKPVIIKTEPGNAEYVRGTVAFNIIYTENNLKGITLFYQTTSLSSYQMIDCPSGFRRQCSTALDLSSYNGQLSYYFTVEDYAHVVNSEVKTIFVDNLPPTISVLSPFNQTYRQPPILNFKTDEQVTLEMSDNGNRFKTLCTDCISYNKPYYLWYFFSYGIHNLQIRATDRAGNVGYSSVTFTLL